MIDLTKKQGLPNVVMINGSPYSIYTDFRVWLKFEINFSKAPLKMDVSYLFMNKKPAHIDINEILEFARPRNELPRKGNNSEDAIILDYEVDADYIYAAFMSQYGIDLCEIEYLHWHKFLALMKGLKNQVICDIISYRCYRKAIEKRDVYEELREAWRIDRITAKEQAEIDKFNSYFN